MTQSDDFSLLLDKKSALEIEITELEAERGDIINKLADAKTVFNFPKELKPEERGRYIEFEPIYGLPLWEFVKDMKEVTTFEERRGYIERFNVRVEVKQDDLGVWLNIQSDLGPVLSELSPCQRTRP
jgi:hypothetical protein